jgi:hypothetical protein
MATCLEYGHQRTESCEQYSDQGYSSCSDWDAQCCTWWPCSWFCEAVTWLCVAWVWVSHVVCVLWVQLTTLVCVLWDIVVTIVSAIFVVLEAAFGWILSVFTLLIELIFAIPIVGRILQWLWNAVVLNLAWLVANLIDAGFYIIGVRPQKKLRVCTVILRDEQGRPLAPVADVVTLINDAIDILLSECNVQLINSAPLQFSSGLSTQPRRADASWVQIDSGSSPTAVLDVACDAPAFAEDLRPVGPQYQIKGLLKCFFGSWRNVLGLGTPVTVLIVRSITRPPVVWGGCCIWVSNYLTVSAAFLPGPQPNRILAHELGHACNLWHVTDPPNLMDVTPGGLAGTLLRFWQEVLLRASRHVSYL